MMHRSEKNNGEEYVFDKRRKRAAFTDVEVRSYSKLRYNSFLGRFEPDPDKDQSIPKREMPETLASLIHNLTKWQ